jgi:haloalkane dehalogenase
MGTLERSPDLLQGAVILNTVLTAPTDDDSLPFILRFVKTPVVAELVLEGVVSIFDQLPDSQNDPESMQPGVIDLYARPVNESGNAKGPLAILRMSADGVDHPTAEQARTTETYIRGLDVPAEIVWGMNDPRLGERLTDMVELFPNGRVTETSAGHFLQEEGDAPEKIADSVMRVHEQILAAGQ